MPNGLAKSSRQIVSPNHLAKKSCLTPGCQPPCSPMNKYPQMKQKSSCLTAMSPGPTPLTHPCPPHITPAPVSPFPTVCQNVLPENPPPSVPKHLVWDVLLTPGRSPPTSPLTQPPRPPCPPSPSVSASTLSLFFFFIFS